MSVRPFMFAKIRLVSYLSILSQSCKICWPEFFHIENKGMSFDCSKMFAVLFFDFVKIFSKTASDFVFFLYSKDILSLRILPSLFHWINGSNTEKHGLLNSEG